MHCRLGDPQHLRGLLARQTRKKPQLDQFRFARILVSQFLECIVESEQIHVSERNNGDRQRLILFSRALEPNDERFIETQRGEKQGRNGDGPGLQAKGLLALQSVVEGLIVDGADVTLFCMFGGGCERRASGHFSRRTRGAWGNAGAVEDVYAAGHRGDAG